MFDIYEMLDTFRQRPSMYFGEDTLSNLSWFLQGYQAALIEHEIPFRKVGPWNGTKFHNYVERHFGVSRPGTTKGFHTVLLNHTDGDEAKAIALFYELLDEFRSKEQL